MSKDLRADGQCRGKGQHPIAAIGTLRPALTDIAGACAYFGNISRAKFYADILPRLDIVKFGTRTLVTIESLDRLIAANRKPGSDQSPDVSAPQHGSYPISGDKDRFRFDDRNGDSFSRVSADTPTPRSRSRWRGQP
jgi:hypothetical protein